MTNCVFCGKMLPKGYRCGTCIGPAFDVHTASSKPAFHMDYGAVRAAMEDCAARYRAEAFLHDEAERRHAKRLKCPGCADKVKVPGLCKPCFEKSRPCLEPNCAGRAVIHEPRCVSKHEHFCPDHRGSDWPTVDRDGDPIWVTGEGTLLKVKEMKEGHLTNALAKLERDARARLRRSGVDEDKFEEVVSPRYHALLDEAKRRDARLACPCADGVVGVETVEEGMLLGTRTTTRETFCPCRKGQERAKAKAIAAEMSKRGPFDAKMAAMVVVALIAGGAAPLGAHFVELVLAQLRAMGVLK